MLPQPLIAVRDVENTSTWCQRTLGLVSVHGGAEYEQLMFNGQMVLQLHRWDAHEHPNIGNPDLEPHGNGVVLWFEFRLRDPNGYVVVVAGPYGELGRFTQPAA